MTQGHAAAEAVCRRCRSTYLRLPGAKSGLCCGCRRSARLERGSTTRRDPVDPAAFVSQAALDEWYAADKLRCHICGGEFPGLYQHVGRAHGINAAEYKRRFGIPVGYGLSGRSTRAKQRKAGSATSDKMRAAGFENLAAARASKTGKRTQWVPYQAREHAVRMVEAPGHPSNLEGMATVWCTSCGDPFLIAASIALSRQCRATCEACASGKKTGKRGGLPFRPAR